MSGSIGGKRIKRIEVKPTLSDYIEKVLGRFPGFISAQITGSYNTGIKEDHGDIDIAVHIDGVDVKKIKKEFKEYLNSLDNNLTPVFESGKNVGKKSQMYGSIVTCGFPIHGRSFEYVQIDNIIVCNRNEQQFQKEFLDLDAAKQGLVMGLIRVILNYYDFDEIKEYFHINNISKLSNNQEYEFVLSSAGLSLRKVTLTKDMKEESREELWRCSDWNNVIYLLKDFDLNKSYYELLHDINILTKNDTRSRNRIVGIMKSMIKIGPGEVGTKKGYDKENAINSAIKCLL